MIDNRIDNHEWVRETRFGRWFLSTQTWVKYVLDVAIKDFAALSASDNKKIGTILDAGCGQGSAFNILNEHFKPAQIIGLDVDSELLEIAKDAAEGCPCEVTIKHQKASDTDIPDNSVDMIFCHQLLHHTKNQMGALLEFKRILAPDGVLLVGESCESFIHSLPVKLLFKHPDLTQKDAAGYIDLVREAGFVFQDKDIQKTSPWWSRPFLGVFDKWIKREIAATEILIVARKG